VHAGAGLDELVNSCFRELHDELPADQHGEELPRLTDVVLVGFLHAVLSIVIVRLAL
jgi:hypothetical protein